MATPIPDYHSLDEIIAAVELQWPDNNSRQIAPIDLRSVVLGIAKFVTVYYNTKPEVITFTNQTTVTIPLTADRIAAFGYVPAPFVFFGDNVNGWQYTPVPWSIDRAPDITTTIIVEVGGPSSGIIILK
jgi:hypothetical protein